jgi:hypothetical protein
VGNAGLERWTGLENPPKNEGSHRQCVFYDYTNTIGQAVLIGAGQQQVILRLGVKEQHGTQCFRGLEQRRELRFVPGMALHHGVELGTFKAEGGHGAL